MFFELLDLETNQGDIGYAESEDGIEWKYQGIAIDEPFHLSYPYVFKMDNEYYLIPESTNDLSVRLYRAINFPNEWEYIGNLLSGHHYIDPSIFYYNNKWWLYVYSHIGILNLYYSDDLLDGWRPHPMNPIVKFNDNIARPGGRVFTYRGRLYRLAQDCDPTYGLQVFAHEIIELTKDHYKEKLALEKPIVTFTGKGWNAGRMHHVDLHKVGEEWITVVDGKDK